MISAAGASSPLPILKPIPRKLYHALEYDNSCSLLGQAGVLYLGSQTTDLAGTHHCAIQNEAHEPGMQFEEGFPNHEPPINVRIRPHSLPSDGKQPRYFEKLFFCKSTGLIQWRTVSKRTVVIRWREPGSHVCPAIHIWIISGGSSPKTICQFYASGRLLSGSMPVSIGTRSLSIFERNHELVFLSIANS